jgi:hypothetical protein
MTMLCTQFFGDEALGRNWAQLGKFCCGVYCRDNWV